MTDPLSFPSSTPRFGLPLLFAGQAQKEMSVNTAHSLADCLLHPTVEGEAIAAPATPAEGECWLVASGAEGLFAGREGQLASFQSGTWLFASGQDGMRIFDRATSQFLIRDGVWKRPAAPSPTSGGSTIDVEARDKIDALIASLRESGIFPRN